MNFKNFFFDNKPVVGTATNSWLALVFSLACAAFVVVGFLIGRDLALLGVVCWVVGILQVRKGLVSDKPGPAKIGRIVLFVDVALLIASAVLLFMRTLGSITPAA